MGVFQSVGGAATSGRGLSGRQVAEAIRAAAEEQRRRHLDRIGMADDADASPEKKASAHRRSRSGVVQSMGDIEAGAFEATAEVRTVSPDGPEIIVTEYAPEAFRYLRQLEGVQEQQFCDEWTLPEDRLKMELGEGRSMALFLKSKSLEFMCKTISDVEVNVLLRRLKAYTQHLAENRHSLLMRFLMLLKVQVGSEVGYILCFSDIFAGCDRLNERWDIKGRRPKPGKYRQFPKWAEEQNGDRMVMESPTTVKGGAFGNPTQSTLEKTVPHFDSDKLLTRKDKDLTRLFWLGEEEREELIHQLEQDFKFLRSCGLMDYSILIGVKYCQGPTNSRRAKSMRMTYALGEEHLRGVREERSKSRASSPAGFSFQYDPNVITHNSKYHYGVPSLQGHETYYIGLIDMLTEYNWKKKTANFCKKFLWTEATLSTIPPKGYEQRIDRYAHRIFVSHDPNGSSPVDPLAMTVA